MIYGMQMWTAENAAVTHVSLPISIRTMANEQKIEWIFPEWLCATVWDRATMCNGEIFVFSILW